MRYVKLQKGTEYGRLIYKAPLRPERGEARRYQRADFLGTQLL